MLSLLIVSFQKFLSKFLILFLIFLNGCALSPGMSTYTMEEIEDISNFNLNFIDSKNIDFSKLPSQPEKNIINENNLTNLIANNQYRYLLGQNDTISISVTDIDDINGEFTIDDQGAITLPYAGKIIISNLTKNEAENFIKESLSYYYQEPEVIITIKEFKSRYVYITGEIAKPQSILLTEKKLSLTDAIIDSGYIKDQKSFDKKALLKRNEKIYIIDLYKLFNEIDIKYNIFLREDDIVHIQKKSEDKIHVFGEAKQGTYSLYDNPNLTRLLSNANINQVTADLDRVYVIREDLSQPYTGNIYEFKLKNPNFLLLANKFNLLNEDVIFVSPAPIVRWNRVISLITPQSGIFKTYDDIDNVVNK